MNVYMERHRIGPLFEVSATKNLLPIRIRAFKSVKKDDQFWRPVIYGMRTNMP